MHERRTSATPHPCMFFSLSGHGHKISRSRIRSAACVARRGRACGACVTEVTQPRDLGPSRHLQYCMYVRGSKMGHKGKGRPVYPPVRLMFWDHGLPVLGRLRRMDARCACAEEIAREPEVKMRAPNPGMTRTYRTKWTVLGRRRTTVCCLDRGGREGGGAVRHVLKAASAGGGIFLASCLLIYDGG